jgi:small subunit ribosomal protein S8e
MGISRDNRTKRRATGGKKKHFRKNRKLEIGRQPTLTKLGEKRTTLVRKRGGAIKVRALRLDAGNFGWGTEGVARKARILGVTYNSTSNELVRTNTLVKNSIIQIDATPFR